ncbi:MAG: hypothetical protein ACLP5H_07730 [Desulfomonilaceae bacterium]
MEKHGLRQPSASNSRLLWLLAAGLVTYAITLTALTGDIGFEGDDWWVLSWPYWHQFPGSVWSYAKEFLRPVEGLYWIGMFEIFGLNSLAFHLCSLLLQAGSCVLMGVCLSKAFPERRLLVVLSVVFAFFLPMIASLTYIVFTDNSRLSLLLFWAATLAFQTWTARSQSWIGLVPPILIYLLSFLTYEAASFLIFIVPLLAWPIHKRCVKRSDKSFLLRIGAGVITAFTAALAIRFLLLHGGAVDNAGIVPSPSLVGGYLALLPFYLAAPFTSIPHGQPWVWVVALLVTSWVAGLIILLSRQYEGEEKCEEPAHRGHQRELFYLLLIGTGILFCGMLPYQLAGYGSAPPTLIHTALAKWGIIKDSSKAWFNFNEAGRLYSSASFGVALLLATLVTAWKSKTAQRIASVAAVICIGCMALFHAGLSKDWKEAAHKRNDLLKSLISQVPEVKPKTNFVFFDLESYHKRAAVIRGWAGLRELIRMLYGDRTLGAWYVYRATDDRPMERLQQGFVLPKGFVSRGMTFDEPAPHDSLLLLKRRCTRLKWVDELTADATVGTSAISWRGGHALRSNPERVIPWEDTQPTWSRITENRWEAGLTSTLNLIRLSAGAHRFFKRTSPLRDYLIAGPYFTK